MESDLEFEYQGFFGDYFLRVLLKSFEHLNYFMERPLMLYLMRKRYYLI